MQVKPTGDLFIILLQRAASDAAASARLHAHYAQPLALTLTAITYQQRARMLHKAIEQLRSVGSWGTIRLETFARDKLAVGYYF